MPDDDEESPRRFRPLFDTPGDDADDSDGTDDPDEPFGGPIVDFRTNRMLERFTSERGPEAVEPRRNWSPVVAVAIGLAVVGLAALASLLLIRGSSSGEDGGQADGSSGGRRSVLDEGLPTLDDLLTDSTAPDGPDTGLEVAAQGVTLLPDRFDEGEREGTFAVVIENPHDAWLAQGVEVSVQLLDASGFAVGEDRGFIEVVLPGQRVAIAALLFDAPATPIADLDVRIDVARWREVGPIEGEFVVSDVQTGPGEVAAVRTTFRIESRFDEVLTDVGVTAVYRDADGQVIGGYDTFVERLEPGRPTTGEVELLANLDPAQIASTELYPTAAFGSIPGT